jgi:outer membrane protein OmpA-like peptidoglycan-associated protein
MMRRIVPVMLSLAVAVLVSACATKDFVRELVGSTDTKLKETTERTAANTQAIDATGQRVQALDSRVGEVNSLATDARGIATDARGIATGAKKDAEAVGNQLRQTETELSQRLANRNKYAELGAKSVFFDFNRASLQDNSMSELDEIAGALKADPNAVVELKGFADQRGPDRYNFQLTRERVDAVVRYLVERHGIDLRRIHAVGMGRVAATNGAKPTKEDYAKNRRVDVRLLAPQS